MKDAIVLAAFAFVVGAIVALLFAMGFRKPMNLDPAALIRVVEGYEPGAKVVQTLIGEDCKAGLALLDDGRIALARVVGADAALRLIRPNLRAGRLKSTSDGVIIRFSSTDLGFPALVLKAPNAPDWVRPFLKD